MDYRPKPEDVAPAQRPPARRHFDQHMRSQKGMYAQVKPSRPPALARPILLLSGGAFLIFFVWGTGVAMKGILAGRSRAEIYIEMLFDPVYWGIFLLSGVLGVLAAILYSKSQ